MDVYEVVAGWLDIVEVCNWQFMVREGIMEAL